MNTRGVEAQVFHADGHDEVIVVFRDFANASNKNVGVMKWKQQAEEQWHTDTNKPQDNYRQLNTENVYAINAQLGPSLYARYYMTSIGQRNRGKHCV